MVQLFLMVIIAIEESSDKEDFSVALRIVLPIHDVVDHLYRNLWRESQPGVGGYHSFHLLEIIIWVGTCESYRIAEMLYLEGGIIGKLLIEVDKRCILYIIGICELDAVELP